jgi:purine-binding chemotaxis protein CheW
MAKKNDRKALGSDPFANGDNLLAEEGIGVPEGSGEKPEVEAKVAAEAPQVKTEEESKAGAKPKAKKKTATKAKGKPEAEKKAATKPKTKKKAATKAKGKPEARKEAVTEAEVKPEAEKKAAARAKAKPKAEKEAVTEAQVKPEAEVAADAEGPVSEVVAEPDEEASRLLDELMATIDGEVEEAFGPGAMTDLATTEPTDQEEGEEQYIIFSLAESEYAILADNVREIGEPPNVTPVPNVPDWVLGVTNLRGDVLSLVDLRIFLDMEPTDYDEDTRVMVVHAQQDGSSVTTGLIVDLVSDIRYLPVDQITAPAAPIEDQVAPYLRGVHEHDGRLLAVLDFDRLLLSPEMRQFEPV